MFLRVKETRRIRRIIESIFHAAITPTEHTVRIMERALRLHTQWPNTEYSFSMVTSNDYFAANPSNLKHDRFTVRG